MSTPNYVLAAIRRYLEDGNGDCLAQMFKGGIPLHTYPESREIVINLLMGKPNRRKGKPTHIARSRNQSILMRVAEMHGAGLGVYSAGNNSKPTACTVVAKIYGLSADYIYKEIWTPNKDSADVKRQMELGALDKNYLSYLEMLGYI